MAVTFSGGTLGGLATARWSGPSRARPSPPSNTLPRRNIAITGTLGDCTTTSARSTSPAYFPSTSCAGSGASADHGEARCRCHEHWPNGLSVFAARRACVRFCTGRRTIPGKPNRRSVPQPDPCSAAKIHYSITSSARASSVGGISSPSALAVIMLMTRSNLVGCSTGMSPGFAPRRILST